MFFFKLLWCYARLPTILGLLGSREACFTDYQQSKACLVAEKPVLQITNNLRLAGKQRSLFYRLPTIQGLFGSREACFTDYQQSKACLVAEKPALQITNNQRLAW